MRAEQPTHVLRIACPDATGLIHRITGVLFDAGPNIVATGEFVDPHPDRFYIPTQFGTPPRSRGRRRETVVLATAACHGVVRAGDRLGETEARALIADIDGIDHHGSCPHGRPVLLTMPQGEIERRFGRA